MNIDFTVQQFLLALSGLISIVNPIGGAFIFAQVTSASLVEAAAEEETEESPAG